MTRRKWHIVMVLRQARFGASFDAFCVYPSAMLEISLPVWCAAFVVFICNPHVILKILIRF